MTFTQAGADTDRALEGAPSVPMLADADRAIHVIATSRMRCDPATIAYVTRRRAEGKTTREIRRCLKRYIARQLYRTPTTALAPATPEKLRLDKHRSVEWNTGALIPRR